MPYNFSMPAFLSSKGLRSLLFLLLLLSAAWFYLFHDLPSIQLLPQSLNQPSIRITDRSGRLLYEVIPQGGGRNATLAPDQLPTCIKDATVAVEDKTFYTNPGLDFMGILRAAWFNLYDGQILSGASTITQQVARTLLLPDERTQRTLRRKLRESLLAWRLTRAYSKDEILALYLNQVYYGGMSYGIEAAAQTYFAKSASDLLLPECALLAGLPQTPGAYNPFTNPELAQQRQRVVLGLMEKNGFITTAQRLDAWQAPLSYASAPYPIEAPHFIWMVRDAVDQLSAAGQLDPRASLVVRTTLDLDSQHLAEDIIARRLASFQPQPGEIDHNVNNAALLVIQPGTGQVLAMVGSAGYFNTAIHGAINMATAPRQPGSAFKPFIYAAALDPAAPHPLTPAATLLDVQQTFTTRDNQPYQPVNYDRREHGFVSVRQALASSLNIPAVLVLQHAGIEPVLTLAKKLGIQSLREPAAYDLSLALGGGQISLLELSRAYAALANGGKYLPTRLILDIHAADGALLYTPPAVSPRQVIDSRLAWLLSDILSDDAARRTGFGLNSVLKLDRPAAVKTGTTTNFHDNWTIGYTPNLLVGVWVGNSDYQAMHAVTGLTGAAPIWAEAIRALSQGQPQSTFPRPPGLLRLQVCALSGLLPTPECLHTRQEWFIPGTEPVTYDHFYQRSATGEIQLDLPLAARAWARTQGLPLVSTPAAPADARSLILTSPIQDTVYRLDPHLPSAAQQLPLSALVGQEISQVTFIVDGRIFATLSAAPYQSWWTLSPGLHHFWLKGLTTSGEEVASPPLAITVVE